jgi:hypothetical protein
MFESVLIAFAAGVGLFTPADDASVAQGEPVLEPATLHSLGLYWIIRGDDNRNAKIELDYRKSGAPEWKKGPPLFRVERGGHRDREGGSKLTEEVPADGWLFAGSLVLLEPGTPYELRVRLTDPDGGAAEKLLHDRTTSEPGVSPAAPTFHVVPGLGGGTGSAADPYKGLASAESQARPGDLFLVHAGAYPGVFVVKRSGEPGKPIVWRGAGDGEAIVGGPEAAPRGILAEAVHDVWFERLAVRNKDYGLVGQESGRLVIRRCHFQGVKNGIHNSRNASGNVRGWWISDNVLEGVSPWPRPGGKMDDNEWRGIQLTGMGHDVCYNRVHHFKDAIDTFASIHCAAIDFHHNDVSELNDDGFEMDYSERNVRNFHNRVVNAFCGISVQPIYGGPAYIFRNVLYNITNEPLKMHNSPSGVLVFHNTSVRKGMALQLFTPAKVRNSVSRNNLFVGSSGPFAYENNAPMVDCDFDYDGFAGGPWRSFLKWNGVRYQTFEEMKAKAPVYRHAVQLEPGTLFASGAVVPEDAGKPYEHTVDLRLKGGSAALGAGEVLPGLSDGVQGRAPDLGAYDLGQDLPVYGPRPEK